MQRYHSFETAHGIVAIAWNGNGVTALRLPSASAAESERAIRRRLPDADASDPPPGMAAIIADIRRYFTGEPIDFSDLPLDIGEQSPLFTRIYAAVRALRWGESTTYGAVAKAIGAGPEAARDVGQAMGSNPVPLIIPCHRVLAAGNRIGGFSAPGGSQAKARMLTLEGVAFAKDETPRPSPQASFGF
ncbi:methylated-DNA--[protein]-cysteine S-methyltransferase [Sphingomonas sp. LB-2]|uniref:methylated-DNA--[protein]-cysteine S-methyltransferase n=1 Tax=Sphingomonas caeni TaxID=2984949 RepID=UPI00223050C8|nr:methylated-DNA--[protein]-cysteine S-methyltransferase [Sphingomonas caeni]MCW3848516.1 methylated-DNA--[protein]-cysteine S-methyltransferase [Sphingomonas caeni]